MPTRMLVLAWVASIAVVSCGDSSDSTTTSGGAAGLAGAGSGGEAQIPFCAALEVIRDKCQRCHQSPPQHGAPVPFLTYEDTQAQYYTTDQKWSDAMVGAVARDFMPDLAQNNPPLSLMPPVEPLTADEKQTLLGWLAQGAKPEGGTKCP
jgi:hypothetical protein